jgi:hypothetical protein
MAGRVQLLTSGPQDRFFTVNPDYSYFLQSFKKHSNFAREYVNIDPENTADFGGKVRFRVAQNTGDLLTTVSVKMKLPAISLIIYDDPRYIESIGHALIEHADLIIGGKIIQRIPSDYLQIYSEHNVTLTKQRALKELIGKYPERTVDTRVSDKDILGVIGTANQEEEFFVDLPFYFYNNPELAIPLCSITKQEVEVEIKIRNHDHLIIKGTTGQLQPVTPGTIHLKDFRLVTEVVFLDPIERIRFLKKKNDYIITQVQQNVFDVAQGVQEGQFKLDFVNPVRELYFVIQRQGDTGTGEGEFITPFDYDNTLEVINGKYILYENLDYLTLDLDGQSIITQETGNVIFLKAVQAAIHHSKTQLIRRFYSYSFALEPEKWYPTGQINFSLIKEQIINLSLTPCADYARQIKVYALSHNILRVSEGTARTIFDVKY